jgi:hypothetical protein
VPYLSERFSRVLVSWLLITILSFFCSNLSHALDDPAVRDTVRFDIPDDQVPGPPATAQLKIGVVFFYDTDISFFAVPLCWAGPLFLDSVVFSPFMKDYLDNEAIQIDNENNNVLLGGIGEEPDIPPGTHLMGHLYFTAEDTGETLIDSCFLNFNSLIFGNAAWQWAPVFIEAEFTISAATHISGDANRDGVVEIADVVFLINYLFRGGEPPDPVCSCDVNTDCSVSLADVVYLINYVLKSGPAPLGNCYPCS